MRFVFIFVCCIFFFFFFFFLFCLFFFFFFFSSRRRHTRWNCDRSSDVCSSDLKRMLELADLELVHRAKLERKFREALHKDPPDPQPVNIELPPDIDELDLSRALKLALERERSEERRVGKECRSRWAADQEKKKK